METESIAHLDFVAEVTCCIAEFDVRNVTCSSEPRWRVHAPCSSACSKDRLLLCGEHALALEEYLTSQPRVLQCKECTQVYAATSVRFVMLP